MEVQIEGRNAWEIVEVGDVWFVRLPGKSALRRMAVKELTERTVALFLARESITTPRAVQGGRRGVD